MHVLLRRYRHKSKEEIKTNSFPTVGSVVLFKFLKEAFLGDTAEVVETFAFPPPSADK